MRLMRCRECGFPTWLGKMYRWEDNGTFCYRLAPDFRGLILQSDLFGYLFSRIEEDLGVPISHIVFEAQRNASREAVELLLGKSPGWLRRTWPVRQFTARFFCHLSIWLGTSYSRVVRYQVGKLGEAIIRNPYQQELMAALVLGAFESLEGQPFRHAWKKSGGDDVVCITPTGEKSELSERLVIEPEKTRPGDCKLERCRRCGVPAQLGSLVWSESEGIITDTRRGERVNFLEAYTSKAVFREMKEELGEAIDPLIVEAGREFARKHLLKLLEATGLESAASDEARRLFIEEATTVIPAWGQGNPVDIRLEDGKIVIVVDNPFEERLLAGYMVAAFELTEDKRLRVEWDTSQAARVVYTLTPE